MKKTILIVFMLLLGGCSTKFVYKNVDWLVYWYIDDFVELTDEQEDLFDKKLAQWLVWHKASELPQYLSHLQELSGDIKNQQLSLEKMDYHQNKARDHWLRIKAKIIPDLVEMSPSLSEEQVVSIFKEIDELNEEDAEERAERLAMSEDKRKTQSLKRNKKNLKRWLGSLNDQQETLVENMYGQYHSNGELWLEYRLEYQKALRALFDESDRGDKFKVKLHELLMNPEVFRGELLNQRNIENSNKYKEFLLAIDAVATEKQRAHILDEIAEFSDDVSDLLK
mmetsp:Transcript_44801/g.142661  ORF Transcript_44801/g.142661 Transcript_44801/m.142661 type:complete len:281 (+) Transcript_44801:201-1043(+)